MSVLHANITQKATIVNAVHQATIAINLKHSSPNSPVPSVTVRQASPIRVVIMIREPVDAKRNILGMSVASVRKVLPVSPSVQSVSVITLAH